MRHMGDLEVLCIHEGITGWSVPVFRSEYTRKVRLQRGSKLMTAMTRWTGGDARRFPDPYQVVSALLRGGVSGDLEAVEEVEGVLARFLGVKAMEVFRHADERDRARDGGDSGSGAGGAAGAGAASGGAGVAAEAACG